MAIETAEQIQQYLVLQDKTETELRAICEGLELSTEGSKEELLERVTSKQYTQQTDVLLPQAIPLRSRDDEGNLIELAQKTYNKWRRLIYNTQKNWKEFKLLNAAGKEYSINMRYIRISPLALKKILEDKWYDPRYIKQRELLDCLRTNPEDFNVAIIQKFNSSGNSWIMLHVCPRAQEAA